MKLISIFFFSFWIFFISCNTSNSPIVTIVSKLDRSLEEISATETISNSSLIWAIEDSNNKNTLYGINTNGIIEKKIKISNAENKDWEDLTSDYSGNLYIGDFGNNNGKRKKFTIYKILNSSLKKTKTKAEIIEFTLPKKNKKTDFEAFFIYENNFYIFSKESTKTKIFKVPNKAGTHKAILIDVFKMKGKNTSVTSGDISSDGSTIVLLNHGMVWKISNFKKDAFFEGSIEKLSFNHSSQKEGVCFKSNNALYITDEYTVKGTGNLYEFKIN